MTVQRLVHRAPPCAPGRPSDGAASREAAFAALQRTLAPFDGAAQSTLVVIPSVNAAPALMEAHRDDLAALEERWLYLLFALRRPQVRVVFVSSLAIPDAIVDHYLSLMPDAPDARRRLTLLAADDASPRPLAAKLLERPGLLRRIRLVAGRDTGTFIAPYWLAEAERDLALELDLPVYGIDHRFAEHGTKSGSRRLFAAAGVAHPAGFEDIRTRTDLQWAVTELAAERPGLRAVVAKHDDGVYGEGNRILPVDAPLQLDAAWLSELECRGGIVEELLEGEEVRSPSVQLRVIPGGGAEVIGTHDQVLGGANGQSFTGCRFPADRAYAALVTAEARKVGDLIARTGAVGRLAVDFVVTRDPAGLWRTAAVEVNLREGGTSHPYGALWLLTGGRLSADGTAFLTPAGEERCYVATDRLASPRYRGIAADALIAAADAAGLLYDPASQAGIVLFMLRRLEPAGTLGLVAIGTSHADAERRQRDLVGVLERLADPAPLGATR